jgi:hypothetical protein
MEELEDLENVEELVGENEFRTLLVRSSAGGAARVTILVPAIVPVSDLLSLMPLMPFSKLLFRAVRESLRFSVTWTDHRYVSAQASCAIDLTINRVAIKR